eukprot:768448-Hanusia_phi.AAC.16
MQHISPHLREPDQRRGRWFPSPYCMQCLVALARWASDLRMKISHTSRSHTWQGRHFPSSSTAD